MRYFKLLFYSLIVFILFFAYTFAKTKTHCGYNRYGNYYCSYSDGSYEYWNKQEKGNPYYGLPYYYSNGSNSYNNSSSYTNVLSQNEQCNLKYSGTEYRSSDGWCACPGDAKGTSSWSSTTKSCKRQGDSACEKKYGSYSEASSSDYNTCVCKAGYRRNSTMTLCEKKPQIVCGSNAYLGSDDLCYCKNGYGWDSQNKNYCVTMEQSCKGWYGDNVHVGSDNLCYCDDGYGWDSQNKNYCVTMEQSCKGWYGSNAHAGSDNLCYCDDGYGWNSQNKNYCVTMEQSCKGLYGDNSYAIGNDCYCKIGYKWNVNMTNCVKFLQDEEIIKTGDTSDLDIDALIDDIMNFSSAYDFAYKNGITTMYPMLNADLHGSLDRIAMAKMIGNYAINVLGITPDITQTCYFTDITDKLNKQYDNGVTKACQLGLMGQNISAFRPRDKVTRAEFATALSRLMNRNSSNLNKLNSANPYYLAHMKYLQDNGIIDDLVKLGEGDKEIRGYVMMMLMRADDFENMVDSNCTAEQLLVCVNSDDMYECISKCEGD